MNSDNTWNSALERLHNVQIKLNAQAYDVPMEPSLTGRDAVLDRFQSIFSPAHLPALTEVEFRSSVRPPHVRRHGQAAFIPAGAA
jgi:hypothetical protein